MPVTITIQFSRSRSKQFNAVLRNAASFKGFGTTGGEYSVSLSPAEIFTKWTAFQALFSLAGNWASFSVVVNGTSEVKPMKLFYQLQEIRNCHQRHKTLGDVLCNGCHWGCRLLTDTKTKPTQYGFFWYDCGYFNEDKTVWHIDKEALKERLLAEIAQRQLRACPVFLEDVVLAAAEAYPDNIELAGNPDWQIVTEKRFVGSTIVDVPVGITHRDSYHGHPAGGVVVGGVVLDFHLPADDEPDGVPGTRSATAANPYPEGSDEWANWEIENYLRNNRKR